jgi:hypothetical protein
MIAALLVLSLQVSLAAGDTDDEAICDDGSPAFHRNDRPNWSCMRRGCSPSAAVCWTDRLDECRDDAGDIHDSCRIAVETCNSRLSCFDLWLYCEGVYTCHESGGVGCKSGTCETNTAPLEPPAVLECVWEADPEAGP